MRKGENNISLSHDKGTGAKLFKYFIAPLAVGLMLKYWEPTTTWLNQQNTSITTNSAETSSTTKERHSDKMPPSNPNSNKYINPAPNKHEDKTEQQPLFFTGTGFPPKNITNPSQRQAMAKRAALIVAKRNLLEYIKDTNINSDTKVSNGDLVVDQINTSTQGTLSNIKIVYEKLNPDGSAEVKISYNPDNT